MYYLYASAYRQLGQVAGLVSKMESAAPCGQFSQGETWNSGQASVAKEENLWWTYVYILMNTPTKFLHWVGGAARDSNAEVPCYLFHPFQTPHQHEKKEDWHVKSKCLQWLSVRGNYPSPAHARWFHKRSRKIFMTLRCSQKTTWGN